MKILVRQSSLRGILNWTQRALFAAGILSLVYCTFVVADTWMFQRRERQNLERLLRRERPPASPRSPAESSLPPAIGPDDLIGQIEIERLGVSVVVVEGTSEASLRRAAGHIAGTALPGQIGNIGIAAHRDRFFRPLRSIRQDDIITFTTLRGEFRYRVVSTKIANASDVAVLDPDGHEVLTLVTCYPFYFVGAAPDRFIVRAERVS